MLLSQQGRVDLRLPAENYTNGVDYEVDAIVDVVWLLRPAMLDEPSGHGMGGDCGATSIGISDIVLSTDSSVYQESLG